MYRIGTGFADAARCLGAEFAFPAERFARGPAALLDHLSALTCGLTPRVRGIPASSLPNSLLAVLLVSHC